MEKHPFCPKNDEKYTKSDNDAKKEAKRDANQRILLFFWIMGMYLVMDDSLMIKYLRVVTSYLISNIIHILTSPREYILASIPYDTRNYSLGILSFELFGPCTWISCTPFHCPLSIGPS